ncbi:diacylglycerol acyltransferase-domain-containing protein [Stachybotrys elegans]|uniref:diacylglycerol O-acyltransferase n=1 Tax=Stachybotrys elegans TaxID=80388 RepID=A0A8K0SZU4_9HYPO|nr:diacylglycerol acyltransferase-domain-containing protein [Stachybotrys elegans]
MASTEVVADAPVADMLIAEPKYSNDSNVSNEKVTTIPAPEAEHPTEQATLENAQTDPKPADSTNGLTHDDDARSDTAVANESFDDEPRAHTVNGDSERHNIVTAEGLEAGSDEQKTNQDSKSYAEAAIDGLDGAKTNGAVNGEAPSYAEVASEPVDDKAEKKAHTEDTEKKPDEKVDGKPETNTKSADKIPSHSLENASQNETAVNGDSKSYAEAAQEGLDEGIQDSATNGHSKPYAAVVSEDLEEDDVRQNSFERDEKYENPYPPLEGEASPHPERDGWKAGGIRFAPMRVPLVRRLQTAAVLFHCMSIVMFVACFWFVCAIPLSWPILVPYLIHLSLSTVGSNGNLNWYRSEYLRSLPLWTLMAGYFPAKLHKTHDLSSKRKYIFGYHPHGIISHGAWLAFATNALGFREKFPGITPSLLTLDNNFRLPFHRDWILAMGVRSVSKESIWNTLTKGGPNNDGTGRSVTIVVGGARESLEAQPGTLKLILKGRKGFVKMALRTGADLVPVVAFGENDVYDQLSPKTHPLVHRIQMFVLKVFKFTLPAIHGRGLLNYDVGLMPYRRPINIVIGRPIEVNKAAGMQPTQEEIDKLHAEYVREVELIWEAYKDQFATTRTSEMQIMA